MLVIREAQLEVFRVTARQPFEDEMVVHLSAFSVPLSRAIGEEAIRKTIRLGVSRAADHGFVARGPVRLYIELMLLFGSFFDTDPMYPWAAEVLQNRDGHEMRRAERLHELTMEYRAAVAGSDDAYALEALRQTRALADRPSPFTAADFASALRLEIERIYPQKAAYAGRQQLDALIREGIDAARAHDLPTPAGDVLISVMMLSFGHGCIDDPLYPWIDRTLRDPFMDASSRVKRLEKKSLTWLDHALTNLEGRAAP